jgi:SAM-dependent methyltransferase
MQLPQFQVHADIEERHWWFLGKCDLIVALLKEVLRGQAAPFVLDTGCGTGGSTAAINRTFCCVGVDPIPEAITYARTRFPEVEFHVGSVPQDCSDLLADADAVLLLDVLEHVEDDFHFVSSILAAMKPGALLLLMAPHDPALWGPHDRGFEHYRRYTLPRLRMLWAGLPVTELLLSTCNARLYPLAKVARFLTRLLGHSFGPSSTDLSLPPWPVNPLFRWIFAGERHRLLRALKGQGRGYAHGVSAIALLRREQGAIVPRRRPVMLPPDPRPWMSEQW